MQGFRRDWRFGVLGDRSFMLPMGLPSTEFVLVGHRMRGMNCYLRREVRAGRKWRKLFNVQLKRSAVRHARILSVQSIHSIGTVRIKSMLERKMIVGEPNFVEGRCARVRSDVPEVILTVGIH
jgi:hypothetical protein